MKYSQQRPKYLSLFRIKQPVTAITSIAHRFSGILLLLFIPIVVYFFDLSLASPAGFEKVLTLFNSLPVRLVMVLMLWALIHHLLAGIRILFIDFDIGVDWPTARRTSWIVNITSFFALLITALVLL